MAAKNILSEDFSCRVTSNNDSAEMILQGDTNLKKHRWMVEYERDGKPQDAIVDYIGGRNDGDRYIEGAT